MASLGGNGLRKRFQSSLMIHLLKNQVKNQEVTSWWRRNEVRGVVPEGRQPQRTSGWLVAGGSTRRHPQKVTFEVSLVRFPITAQTDRGSMEWESWVSENHTQISPQRFKGDIKSIRRIVSKGMLQGNLTLQIYLPPKSERGKPLATAKRSANGATHKPPNLHTSVLLPNAMKFSKGKSQSRKGLQRNL